MQRNESPARGLAVEREKGRVQKKFSKAKLMELSERRIQQMKEKFLPAVRAETGREEEIGGRGRLF